MPQKEKLRLREIATEGLVRDLTTVLSADPEILRRIGQKANTPSGFRIRDEDFETVVSLWGETGLEPDKFNDALSVLKFLRGRMLEKEASVDEFLTEIEELCEGREIPGFQPHRDGLREILTPHEKYLQHRRFMPFAKGVIGNLEAVSGVVDMRAVYQDEDSTELLGYIPVLVLRFARGFDTDDDKHRERWAFQLTGKQLDKLIRELRIYRQKMTEARKAMVEGVEVFGDLSEEVEDRD